MLELPEPALALVVHACGADAAALRGACSHLRSAVDAACTRLTITPAESVALAAAVERYPAVRELRLAGWNFDQRSIAGAGQQLATLMNAVLAHMPHLESISFVVTKHSAHGSAGHRDSNVDWSSVDWLQYQCHSGRHRSGKFSAFVLAAIASAAPPGLTRLELASLLGDKALQHGALPLLDQPAFCNLRHLDMDIFQCTPASTAQLAAALPRLDSLRIATETAAALQPLSALTGLTGLSAHVHSQFDEDLSGNEPIAATDASVLALAALTRLRSLRLRLCYQPNAWAWHAVRSLTTLTSCSIKEDCEETQELDTAARLAIICAHPSLRRLELQYHPMTLSQLLSLAACPCLEALSFHTLNRHLPWERHALAAAITHPPALTALTALTLLGQLSVPTEASFAQLMPGLRRLHVNIDTDAFSYQGYGPAVEQLLLWGWWRDLWAVAAQRCVYPLGISAHPTLEHISIKWPYAGGESEAAVLDCLRSLPQLHSVVAWGRNSAACIDKVALMLPKHTKERFADAASVAARAVSMDGGDGVFGYGLIDGYGFDEGFGTNQAVDANHFGRA